MMNCKYLIIGNSAGGIGAVEAIREVDKKGKIIMVSDEEYHAYSRALIPYYLSEKTSFSDIFIRSSDFYQSKDIVLILGKRVIDVDVEKRVIILDDEDVIGYEKILIATGSKPIIPKFVGVEDTEFFTFTTLNDALIIKDEIETGKYKKAVVLGGGLIGLMAAEALKKKGLDVTVVDLADRVLAPVLDKIGSCIVENHLEENNIHIITKHTIDKVLGEGSVILDDGTELPCEMLILAIGVKPRLELVQGKVKVNRGIVVDRRMRTSVKDVYACGDCAEVYDFVHDDFRLMPLWPTAYVGGRIAGFNMCGVVKEYRWGTNMSSMHFFGLPVITAGISANDEGGYEILKVVDEEKKIYKKIVLRDNRVVGMIFMNKIDRAGIFLGLMRNGTDVSSFKEELLSDDFGLINLPERR